MESSVLRPTNLFFPAIHPVCRFCFPSSKPTPARQSSALLTKQKGSLQKNRSASMNTSSKQILTHVEGGTVLDQAKLLSYCPPLYINSKEKQFLPQICWSKTNRITNNKLLRGLFFAGTQLLHGFISLTPNFENWVRRMVVLQANPCNSKFRKATAQASTHTGLSDAHIHTKNQLQSILVEPPSHIIPCNSHPLSKPITHVSPSLVAAKVVKILYPT